MYCTVGDGHYPLLVLMHFPITQHFRVLEETALCLFFDSIYIYPCVPTIISINKVTSIHKLMIVVSFSTSL